MDTSSKDNVFYKYKYADDLNFVMFKLADTNRAFWQEYFKNPGERTYASEAWEKISTKTKEQAKKDNAVYRGISYGLAGVNIFDSSPDPKDPIDQWLVLAVQADVSHPYEIDLMKIEMSVLVTTSLNANFTTHMGISRSYQSFLLEKIHPGISIPFHGFAAAAMQQHYEGKKEKMCNSPIPSMREIFKKAFKVDNLNDYRLSENEFDNLKQSHLWFAQYKKINLANVNLKIELEKLSEFLPDNNKIEAISFDPKKVHPPFPHDFKRPSIESALSSPKSTNHTSTTSLCTILLGIGVLICIVVGTALAISYLRNNYKSQNADSSII